MGAAMAPAGAGAAAGSIFGPIGALVGAGLGIAGSVISGIGQSNQLEAQSANAAYQAQVAQNNAVIAGRNANMDLQAGAAAPLAFTGSLLSGASSVGGSYFKYLQGGSPGVGAVSGL